MVRMRFDSANLQGTGAARKRAGDKGTGRGRAGYGRREVLTLLPSPPTYPIHTHSRRSVNKNCTLHEHSMLRS